MDCRFFFFFFFLFNVAISVPVLLSLLQQRHTMNTVRTSSNLHQLFTESMLKLTVTTAGPGRKKQGHIWADFITLRPRKKKQMHCFIRREAMWL